MGRFDGKIVSVTGAGTGIGLATATEFAREGATLVVSDRDAEAGEAAAEQLVSLGAEAVFVKADISQDAEVAALFERIRTEFGRLDVQVNNAGIEGAVAMIDDQTMENFDRVIGINLRGTFLCMQAAVRLMKAEGGGVIVNLASITSHLGFGGLSIYSASKAAILSMTKSVALEVIRHGIRVASVSPGLVETGMLQRFFGDGNEVRAAMTDAVPLARTCDPKEIARGILYLASEDGALLVGQTLNLDGGWAFVKS